MLEGYFANKQVMLQEIKRSEKPYLYEKGYPLFKDSPFIMAL